MRVSAQPNEPRPRVRLHRLRIVLDFWWLEMLTRSRLTMGLRAFKVAGTVLGALAHLLLLVGVVVAVGLWRGSVADDALLARVLVVIATLGCLGVSYAGYLRESLTKRRFAVSHSPNATFFRARDIETLEVVAVYRGLPILGSALRSLMVIAVVLSMAQSMGSMGTVGLVTWVSLPAVVLAGCALTFGRAVSNSARTTTRPQPRLRLATAGPLRVGDHGLLLLRHGRLAWQYDAAVNVFIVLGLAVGGSAGIRLSGLDTVAFLEARAIEPMSAGSIGAYATLLVGTIVMELVGAIFGVTKLSDHLRSQWELGADLSKVALAHVMVVVFPGLAVGLGCAMVVGLLGIGSVTGCVVIGVSLAAATTISDGVVPRPRNADDTSIISVVSTLIALGLTLPVVAAVGTQAPLVVTFLYMIGLLLGAFQCTKGRITHHPSSSTMSAQDTTLNSRFSPNSTSTSGDLDYFT